TLVQINDVTVVVPAHRIALLRAADIPHEEGVGAEFDRRWLLGHGISRKVYRPAEQDGDDGLKIHGSALDESYSSRAIFRVQWRSEIPDRGSDRFPNRVAGCSSTHLRDYDVCTYECGGRALFLRAQERF